MMPTILIADDDHKITDMLRRTLAYEGYAVLTNKCPSGANRGIGKVLMCLAMERLVDRVARELDLDPTEIRRRNLIRPDQMPYTTPNGAFYDSGDFGATLQKALDVFGYDDARERQSDFNAAAGPGTATMSVSLTNKFSFLSKSWSAVKSLKYSSKSSPFGTR